MNNTEELVELTVLEESTSNEKKKEVVSFEETTADDAVYKLSEDTQRNYKNNEKNNTKANQNEIQVLLKESDQAATSTIVKSVNKMKRYRRPVFWVQHVQQKQEIVSKGEVGSERLDELLNPDNHGVRWLQQGLEPENEYLNKKEFDYNPTTKNGFLRRVFVILLVMLIVTALLELIYLKIFKKKEEKPQYWYWWPPPPPPEKLKINVKLSASGYSVFAFSGVALLMIYYFWTCSSWSKEIPCILYFSVVLAVLAMSWVILSISFALQTYVFLFALYGLINAALVCLILSYIPKFNFTNRWLYVAVILAVLVSLALCMLLVSHAFSPYDLSSDIACSFLATIIVVILLVFELQLVLNYRTVRIDEDEYFLVACLMYASSVTIFVKLILTFHIVNAD